MEGCSKTEIIKFEKVGCLQAQFGLGAAISTWNFSSYQCFRKRKTSDGNIKIVCNLVLRQLTDSAGLLVGVMGFQQGFDAVLLKDTHLGLYGFHGITRKYTAVRKKIKTGVDTQYPQAH